ncbi:MAG: urease accessory protein UreJ [Epsilonproteobacteria bacterium]|nr:MAG: urease accessory protein UreJ [Campylobacterota bacterium]
MAEAMLEFEEEIMYIPSHTELHGGGFEAGLLHPVLGFDHLLAMVAVGIIATQLGGRAVYIVPLTFVVMMFLGALIGINNVQFLYDEFGIALSVMFLGTLIAFNAQIKLSITLLFITFFAFFHGHAHGIELPKASSQIQYVLGFIIATISLHLFGVLLGYLSTKVKQGALVLSHIGSATAGIGFYILWLQFMG